MALSAQEKNDIAQGVQIASSVLPFPLNFAVLPLVLGITASLTRVRFPRISPADIGRTAAASIRGAVISSDPFFGDIVISQPDQADILTELVRNAAIARVAAQQDSSRLFLQRRAVIEGLAESAVERGFAPGIDPSLRGGVFRPTADAPLQFIEGSFLA